MADAASAPTGTVTKSHDGYVVATWGAQTGLSTAVGVALGRIKPGSMSLQMVGTFGSATFILAGSNDNTNWKACYYARNITAAGKQDVLSATADDAGKVFDDAYRYYRVTSSGGTSTSVTATLVALRD